MCEFISWVELRNKVYFLTGEDLTSEAGKKIIQDRGISPDDFCGHGTIRAFYRIDSGDGVDRECEDFSTPANFPLEIVMAIKDGKMRGLGIAKGLLNQSARAEYDKVEQSARAEYGNVEQSAWAEYGKVNQPAWAEYEKVKQAAFWDLFMVAENRSQAWQ